MSRRIQTADDDDRLLLGGPAAPPEDDYVGRLVKYIPAEIIALYLGVANVIPVTDPSYHLALWIVAGTTAVITPIYMYLATRKKGEAALWPQIVIATLVFPVWVYAIGGPFTFLPWYASKHWIGAVVISFATFLAGAYQPDPPKKVNSATQPKATAPSLSATDTDSAGTS